MTETTIRTKTLEATDFGGTYDCHTPDLGRLVEMMGDAVVSVESTTQPHFRTGEPQDVHRIVYVAHMLRNSTATAMANVCGFIGGIQY